MHMRYRRRGDSSWRMRDDGASAVTVALMSIVLIGMAALVVDLGSLYTVRARLSTAADAAALAGAQELPDLAAATSGARAYATENAPDAPVVSIAFYDGEVLYTADAAAPGSGATVRPAVWRPESEDPPVAENATGSGVRVAPACYNPPVEAQHIPDTIKITVTDPDAPLYFARIWNASSAPVSATSIARVESRALSGVLPFAVVAKSSGGASFGFATGTEQHLIEGAGPGNYGWMTLNDPPIKDPGNSDKWQKTEFEDVMDSNGTDYPVYMTLYPGVTGEKTPYMRAFQGWYDRGNRLALMAVIKSSGPGSKNVQIIGFARMRLTARPAKNDVRALFEGLVAEEDMELAAFWPGSGAQHISLIK